MRRQIPLRGALGVVAILGAALALNGCGSDHGQPSGFSPAPSASTSSASTPTAAGSASTTPSALFSQPSGAQVARGKALATSLRCTGCHSIDGAAGVGPTWLGLAGRRTRLTNGQTVVADMKYLQTAIDAPDAQIVQGYQPGVMSGVIKPGSVSPADTSALIAYIVSLTPSSYGK